MRTKSIRHGRPDWTIRLLQAVAAMGLCGSIMLSVQMKKVQTQLAGEVAQMKRDLAKVSSQNAVLRMTVVSMSPRRPAVAGKIWDKLIPGTNREPGSNWNPYSIQGENL